MYEQGGNVATLAERNVINATTNAGTATQEFSPHFPEPFSSQTTSGSSGKEAEGLRIAQIRDVISKYQSEQSIPSETVPLRNYYKQLVPQEIALSAAWRQLEINWKQHLAKYNVKYPAQNERYDKVDENRIFLNKTGSVDDADSSPNPYEKYVTEIIALTDNNNFVKEWYGFIVSFRKAVHDAIDV